MYNSDLAFKTTTWYNPTNKEILVKLWRGPETLKENKWVHIRVGPLDEAVIPSEYDDAIKYVDKQGRVMGGKAPLLLKNPTPEEKAAATKAETSSVNKATK